MNLRKTYRYNDFLQECEIIWNAYEKKLPLFYNTSGSTGKPKQIEVPFEVYNMAAQESIRAQELTEESHILNITLPPTSIGFPTLSILPSHITGCDMTVKKFDPSTFCDDLVGDDYTHTFFIPAVFRTMSKTKKWKDLDLSQYEVIGCGSDIPPENMKDELFSKGVGRFWHVYGSTEVPPPISASGDIRHFGEDLSPDIRWKRQEDGELYIKWKCQEYYWKSGDLVDENLRMIGRKKNILHLSCSQVHPELVEKFVTDNTNATRARLSKEGQGLRLDYEGKESKENILEKLTEWYQGETVTWNIVNKEIPTNHMNKVVRNIS